MLFIPFCRFQLRRFFLQSSFYDPLNICFRILTNMWTCIFEPFISRNLGTSGWHISVFWWKLLLQAERQLRENDCWHGPWLWWRGSVVFSKSIIVLLCFIFGSFNSCCWYIRHVSVLVGLCTCSSQKKAEHEELEAGKAVYYTWTEPTGSRALSWKCSTYSGTLKSEEVLHVSE